ncbi:TRAP transporter small permease [Varunaivibrio sulfuroxidans]|uniref:TRAP transporter small permease protein n=1 Tax=Varunaivibrio sulfuroxidans TaxID=1773489 RepID=A0A4R3JFE7_9PROT|nr:TRAP transporter small permease [Varunaivibrio sulfuroxidans]TCS63400.1 TRAP-type C4-dicarboxylate transport system permease small subunit [Varunaivibrio sulfuroxidans]WES30454.1 TRAP transporter small permease [Varunaivibrio sulfuroxidans]
MDIFIRSIRAMSTACGVFASLLVASAILVVCQMVVWRYFLNASTVWQTDYITFSLVGAALIGSPYVLLIKGHVNVELLPHYLGHRARVVLALLACLGGLTFSLVLAWSGGNLFLEAWEGGWRTETVWELPLWIPYLAMPVGIGLMALQYVADILALLSGREMPFAMAAHSALEGE